MKKFILTLIKFLSLPVFIISFVIFFYVKRDVYSDFGYHKNYSWKYTFQQLGDLSTKKLLNSSVKYNSFIFGSSRAVGVYACYLQTKIKDSKFFHYANWAETIGGIYAKLNLIDSLGYKLDNVFIYFDTDNTFAGNGETLYNDHYLLTKVNKYSYYYNHFKSFISLDDKFRLILGLSIEPSKFPDWESDPLTNDSRHQCSDSILNVYGVMNNSQVYRQRIESLKKSGVLYDRDSTQKFLDKQISTDEENIMMKIKDLLVKHNSRYYIVITPLYDQLKFNASDIEIIKKIFGDNVYDFSGINEITNNEYNFSDGKHFQDFISKEIIDSIIVNSQEGFRN